ncbi:hypothetical protein KSD_47630 [Ktedonobacter sp. SOSP1-85]|uniref:hypothetical protein n=1 Tax=Ktedonobacter sp. SOSP1-85 TaxID=2778367 RepID=UPI0019153785|nr:hypothetical protein [Ktedonobacter sp. SOSP1-85]GHO76992.1 hypothetical protein KSD_47630 [Ktedonobacter sp. SOSP1-85]
MYFEELNLITRQCMLDELEQEERGGNPYRGRLLSVAGKAAFPDLMRQAILSGNEQTLVHSLVISQYWQSAESYSKGVRRINIQQQAERLGLSEFNTWYVRGFAKRLLQEGMTHCQVYRAAEPKGARETCSFYEGQTFPVEEVYQGHRAQYWPASNPRAFSVPFGPNCHHTIRRCR